MLPQLGTGSLTPNPKNDRVSFRRNVSRHEQGRLREQHAERLGQNVPAQKIEIRTAESSRRQQRNFWFAR